MSGVGTATIQQKNDRGRDRVCLYIGSTSGSGRASGSSIHRGGRGWRVRGSDGKEEKKAMTPAHGALVERSVVCFVDENAGSRGSLRKRYPMSIEAIRCSQDMTTPQRSLTAAYERDQVEEAISRTFECKSPAASFRVARASSGCLSLILRWAARLDPKMRKRPTLQVKAGSHNNVDTFSTASRVSDK